MICFTIVTVFNSLLSCMKTPSLNIFIFLLLPSSKTPTVTKLSSTINRLSSWTICNLAPKIPDTNCNWFSDVFVTWLSLCYCNIFTAKNISLHNCGNVTFKILSLPYIVSRWRPDPTLITMIWISFLYFNYNWHFKFVILLWLSSRSSTGSLHSLFNGIFPRYPISIANVII